jgi:polyisoprenyl-phosphate glycosyltransferase
MMYSIVIPIYNEQENIPELYRRIKNVIDTFNDTVELIFVDDGSKDSSFSLLNQIQKNDQRVKLIRFSRNFGQQTAITAGIDHTTGNAVLLMDGDLQDPPEVFPKFIEKWREGFEVVYAVRSKRQENFLKRIAYFLFYRILRKLSYLDIPLDSGDFCLMDKRVVDTIKNIPERHRFIRGLRSWAGFRQTGLEYERDKRYAGRPKYTLAKLVGLAYDGIFAFSSAPLRFAVFSGFVLSGIAFLGGLFVIYRKIAHKIDIVGWASTIVVIMFLGGLILATLGIIGEYIGRIYDEVKQRPLYVVRDKIGF